MAANTYRWSAERLSYLDARGNVVPDTTIRKAVEGFTRLAGAHMREYTQALQAGTITVEQWRALMRRDVKLAHSAAAIIAHGGREQMTPSDWGWVGQRVRQQYEYLTRFANGLVAREIPLDGRVVRRAGLYAESAKLTFEAMRSRDAQAAGFDQERNILGKNERHCKECPILADAGWVPAGSLPPIGERECRLGCRCVIARRRFSRAA